MILVTSDFELDRTKSYWAKRENYTTMGSAKEPLDASLKTNISLPAEPALFTILAQVYCQQVLGCAVEKCLDLATTHKATSIAFPTLGVGFLGYPRDKSASILFKTINSWYLSNRDTCVQDVQFIVFLTDTESLKVSQCNDVIFRL